ncbi:MAG: response regulator [Phycisphaerales bacterium]|nr:response regulator [Phycisphaerales bacterium]
MSSGGQKQPGEHGRRKPRTCTPGEPAQNVWPSGDPTPRVLVISASRVERESITARLTGRGMSVEQVADPADALAAVATDRFDVAMVQAAMSGGRGLELVRGLHELDGGLGVVMLAKKADLDDAVQAMQAGVLDYLVGSMEGAVLTTRIEQAVTRARQIRTQQQRVERLRRVCRDVNAAREEMSSQVGAMCDDLAVAYQKLTEQMANVGFAAEFNSLIRQELDLESLLRTVLEFVLAKLGPTNAAVFLPNTTGDYTLGAYVNYDCPRDTAEVLLDHLAGVIPERFEHDEGVVLMRTEHALVERLGEQADWLDGHAVACIACHHDDECLAVVTLFRDRHTGFSEEHGGMLAAMASLFAQQLARVIQVHHRHLPKEKWGLDAHDEHEDGADDYGLAA